MSWKKITALVFTILAGLLIVLILVITGPSLWRHFITYPGLDGELEELETKRQKTPEIVDLKMYRGILHAHCYWSHDSRGVLQEFLPAAKEANIDFIYFTDHPRAKLDTFPRAYHGMYDGILIEPGSEHHGTLIWPLDSMIVDWRMDNADMYREVINQGGLIFYGHSEEPHAWENPDYQGMEIYNIHTDSKDDDMINHAPNLTINGPSYRHWAYWEVVDEQTEILALWDSLNQGRRIVGISAADAHDNQNIRARYLEDGRVEWVGPNADGIDTTETGLLEWLLLSEPDENGWAFQWQIDTYYTSFSLCTNYLFADTLTTESITKHLLKGHLYTGFQSIADAEGFVFYGNDGEGNLSSIMGDSVKAGNIKSLNAVSPLPGQFRLIRNGKLIDTVSDAYEYHYEQAIFPGVYRLEVFLYFDSKWNPWVYSNPIYVY